MKIRFDFSDIPATIVDIRKFTTIIMEQFLISDIVKPPDLDKSLIECTKILLIRVKSYTHILEDPKRHESHDGAIFALKAYIDLLAQHYNLMCHVVKGNSGYSDVVLGKKPCDFFPIHDYVEYMKDKDEEPS